MKTFFGGIFVDKEHLKEAGINHPIKLEYYKKINEDEFIKERKAKYGICVVKTEYINDDVKVESKEIEYLCNDESRVNKILQIFKENEVTPIGVEDILKDINATLHI